MMMQTLLENQVKDREAVQGGEFLSFRLGAEEYGIDILKVQELRGYAQPTYMANTPAYLKGVVKVLSH